MCLGLKYPTKISTILEKQKSTSILMNSFTILFPKKREEKKEGDKNVRWCELEIDDQVLFLVIKNSKFWKKVRTFK